MKSARSALDGSVTCQRLLLDADRLVEPLPFRFGTHQDEAEKNDAADDSNEPEERHPAAEVGVVQTADDQRYFRDDDRQQPGT